MNGDDLHAEAVAASGELDVSSPDRRAGADFTAIRVAPRVVTVGGAPVPIAESVFLALESSPGFDARRLCVLNELGAVVGLSVTIDGNPYVLPLRWLDDGEVFG